MFKVIVFDGNGTLFYGLSRVRAIQKFLERNDVRRSEKEVFWAFETSRKIIRGLKDRMFLKLGGEAYLLEVSLWLYFLNAYDERLAVKISDSWSEIDEKKLFSEVKFVLSNLSKKHKLVLLTAGSAKAYIPLLRRTRILRYFSLVVGEDTVNASKPHKSAYQYVIIKLKVKPEEILMVGNDLQNDYYAPKKQGMHAILLDRNDSYKSKKVKRIKFLKELLLFV